MNLPMGGAARCAKTHMQARIPAYQSDPSIFCKSSWIDFRIGSTGSENTGGDEAGDA
jgi:hypothetical protein